MSIATEIQRLQEAKADIKTAIEEKGVEVGNGLIDGYADKVDAVYDKGVSAGKKSQYDEFWDAYQLEGKRTEYTYAFAGNCWNDDAFNPKHDILIQWSQGTNLFRANGSITNIKKPIRFKNVASNSSSTYVFNGCTKLKTIALLEFPITERFEYWFGNCASLENIAFEEGTFIGNNIDLHWSTLLTKESIESIITHLSNEKGATLTLSATAVNNAFTTEEWETFIAENKPSIWTISLE